MENWCYEIWSDDKCFAKEMELEYALIFMKGLMEHFYAEENIEFILARSKSKESSDEEND